MGVLSESARAVLESDGLAHLVTINPDGSPQVSIVWVGLEGDDIVVHGRATIEEGGAPELLQELAHTYLGPDVVFPPMPDPPPGFRLRIAAGRVGGIGPWTNGS